MIPEEKLNELILLRKQIQHCKACYMRTHYDKPVACAGSPIAEVMFVGEAPGAEEVEQGKPFVGRSGQMLRSAIVDAGLDLEQVFITNIISCRPPNNVFPTDTEPIKTCRKWLDKQISFIKPKIIVAVGGKAHKFLCDSDVGITQACGKWEYRGFPIANYHFYVEYLATLHPSFCMRGPMASSPNPIMQLDRQGKENLLRAHIAMIPQKLKDLE